METVPCPGCGGPMGVAQEVCAVCRRPRDEGEIEQGRRLLLERSLRRRRRPLRLALWALAAGAAAAVYSARAPLLARARAARASWDQAVLQAAEGGSQASPASRPAAARTPSARPPAPGRRPAAAPAVSAVQAVATPYNDPGTPADGLRRYYGVVYDLVTTAPVADAVVTIGASGTGHQPMTWTTNTDAEGHYRIDVFGYLPPGSLQMTIAAPGYRPGVMADADPPYRERPRARREETARETTVGDLEPVPLEYSGNPTDVQQDMVLVPPP